MRAKVQASTDLNPDVVTKTILSQLRLQIRQSGHSENALSAAIGRNRGWLGHHLRSGTVPNMVDLVMIADAAGFDVGSLIPSTAISGASSAALGNRFARPDPHDVFRWHLENDGVLKNNEWFEDYYELFEMPDVANSRVKPVYLGSQSVAASLLKLESLDGLAELFHHLDEDDLRDVISEHAWVLKSQKSSISPRTIQYRVTDGHEAIVDYMRILLPVRTQHGAQLIMNYCVTTEMRETFKRRSDSGMLTEDTATPRFSLL